MVEIPDRIHDGVHGQAGDARRLVLDTARRVVKRAAWATGERHADDALALRRADRAELQRVGRTVQADDRCPDQRGEVERTAVRRNDEASAPMDGGERTQ
jgi:hypothetical protein